MTKMRSLFCIIIILLIFSALAVLHNILPLKTDELAAEKYGGWSGVLRVWICEGWNPETSGVNAWLNRCGSAFEKAHEGVYIQVQYVNASAISGICENGVIPPDIIIFPPGLLDTPAHLIPLESEPALLSGLAKSGSYNGVVYAQPIAIGGYAWAYNTAMLTAVPDTWENTGASIAVQTDDAYHHWSAALMGLCSGRYISRDDRIAPEIPSPDMDLGLSLIEETPEPAATAAPSKEDLRYCLLPSDLSFSETAYSDFVAGKISAIPVTQYQIQRLKALSDQGKGPDWRIGISGDMAFTDQILFAAVVDRPDAPEKQALCKSLIYHLLSEECQKDISRAGLFSVTETLSGYDSYDPLRTMEDMLRTRPMYAAASFSASDTRALDPVVRDFLENSGFSEYIYNELSALIS